MVETNEPWVMVTGASSGIGRASAIALAQAGWNVAVHYRQSREKADATARSIEAVGRQALLFQADFCELGSAERLVDEAWSKTGGLGAWFHNAGADLLTGRAASLSFEQKLDLATWVDLWGTIAVCRAVGRRMAAAGRGAIVTMGWDQSQTGMEGDSGELFAAVKGGVIAFTKSLAKSLAPAVRVNCVAPGWIRTAWGENASAVWQERALRETPLGRWGAPEDVAAAVVFLLSNQAAFLTGQTIMVNGGAVG